MPPNRFESEVESFLEGSHGDRTHIKRADHHTVTPLCGTLLPALAHIAAESTPNVARNSPATLSNIEFRSLELQRFLTLLELYPIELRATFLGSCPTVGDVAGGSFLVFCWFLLVRNVARLLLWSCVWLVFGEDLGLLVERNVALVWVCGVCCERKFAPAW